MTYAEIIQTIATNLSTEFDEVYFNAEIVTAEDKKFPAITNKDEWVNLTPTDQRETVYIRRKGDDEVQEELKLGSCIKAYKMRSQLRIVYFKDHASNHSEILYKLVQSVLINNTKLNKVIQDKWKLQKDESSGSYNFGATTAYYAIDIYAYWTLQPETCEQDFCVDIVNPLKKELCPVAV